MQKLDALLKRRRELGRAVVDAKATIANAKLENYVCLLAVDRTSPYIEVPRDKFLQLAESTLASLKKEQEELDATIGAIETLIK